MPISSRFDVALSQTKTYRVHHHHRARCSGENTVSGDVHPRLAVWVYAHAGAYFRVCKMLGKAVETSALGVLSRKRALSRKVTETIRDTVVSGFQAFSRRSVLFAVGRISKQHFVLHIAVLCVVYVCFVFWMPRWRVLSWPCCWQWELPFFHFPFYQKRECACLFLFGSLFIGFIVRGGGRNWFMDLPRPPPPIMCHFLYSDEQRYTTYLFIDSEPILLFSSLQAP